MHACFKEFLNFEENSPKLIDAMLKDPQPVTFLEERSFVELKPF